MLNSSTSNNNGHVDHGKATLLNFLKFTNVVSGEHTEGLPSILDYQVKTEKENILTIISTMLLYKMRARGSSKL